MRFYQKTPGEVSISKMQQEQQISHSRRPFRIAYSKELNRSQLDAVTFKEGPLLVIAGAGSGKTRTLTYRVVRLVEEGVSPKAILLLTFTRKSAQEMLMRATDLLDNRCEKVSGGTFHSFANANLRKYAAKIGFKSEFTILDRVDMENLLGMLRKNTRALPEHHLFPKKQTLAQIISKSVNKGLSIDEIIYDEYPHFSPNSAQIKKIHEEYVRQKREHHFLDYDDLLVYLKQLLQDQPEIRQRISSAYQFIMVDEYQDTNPVQAEILHLLSNINKNIMVVGDDSQSIYAFRGASFKNIMEFPRVFPNTKIIRLEKNYRSVQPILDLANVIIEQAANKYKKNLFTTKRGGTKPVLITAESEHAQSRFVIEKIQDLSEKGIPLGQIAVLFRASFHSFDLEIELAKEEIPFIKVGGFKFMESAHIKDVLAHLRVISNPYDWLSWHRIFLLLDKIGIKTAQNIYSALYEKRTGIAGLFTVNVKTGNPDGFNRLKELFSMIESGHMSIVEMGEAVFNYYWPILKEKYDDHPKRSRDLEQLLTIMDRYRDLEKFLTDMALEPPNSSINNSLSSYDGNMDRLVLSTVHSAKGLEWNTVFVIWTLDGRFPSLRSINKEEELEEEMRLMYVATTRAKENLYFTYPEEIYDRSSRTILDRPSRFLDGLPGDILQKSYL